MARVLLADDEALVRAGFRVILEADGHEVVGEAVDGVDAVRLARDTHPDVVLMDIRMPRLDGIEATELLVGSGMTPPVAVVVVTGFDLDEAVHGAVRAGARGFLLKDAGPRLVQDAVRAALDGESMVSPSITSRLLEHYTAAGSAPTTTEPLIEPLTPREEATVAVVARGLTNAEIADRLCVSVSTVKAHLASAQRKIGARNRTEIAVWAWESGLTSR